MPIPIFSEVLYALLLLIVGGLKVYESFFLVPTPLLEYLLRLFLFYWFLQIILDSFRFLKNLLYQLCFPFRWLHVYLHVREAKAIHQEVNELREDRDDTYDHALDAIIVRASLFSGLNRSDERTGLILGVNRVQYARQIAFAPLPVALVMAVGFVLVTLLIWFLGVTADLGVIVAHFYFFIGIFVVLMPSRNDWFYYMHAAMVTMNIRLRWVHWSMVVYIVSLVEAFWRTRDFLLALLVGMAAFHLYLVVVFMVAMKAMGRHGAVSRIYIFPKPQPAWQTREHDSVEEYMVDGMEL